MLKERTPFQHLTGHAHLSLTTFRKDGEPVLVTLWFAQDGNTLYIMELANADMVKRIRQNAQVEVAPCDADGNHIGTAVEAMARILPPDQADAAKRALGDKSGWQRRVHDFMNRMRGKDMVYIEITPMW